MTEKKSDEPIVQPLACSNRKPYCPHHAKAATRQYKSEVERLCQLLTRDIKEKERMKQEVRKRLTGE